MKSHSRIHKLIFSLSIIALSIISYAIPVFAEDIGPSEWSQYRLNSENNPVYHSEFNSILEDTINTNDQIRSTPVIVGNTAYIGNHNTGDIYSYDLKNKKMNWQAKAPNWIHSELIYMNNQLFVGYGNRFFHEDGTRVRSRSRCQYVFPEY